MKKILSFLGASFVLLALTINAFAVEISKELSKEDIASLEQLKAELTKAADSYNADYKFLINKFNSKTYMEVLTEAKPLIGSVKTQVVYEGKTYDKRAFLHAAIHNLTTRTKSGYSGKDREEFSMAQKLEVMETVYSAFFHYHFYQMDRKGIYDFALNIVENSNINKRTFKEALIRTQNDSPFSTAGSRQEGARYQEKREKTKKGLIAAMKTLPIISYGEQERDRATDAIYTVVKKLIYVDNVGADTKEYTEVIEEGSKALYNIHSINAIEKYDEIQKLKNSKLFKVL